MDGQVRFLIECKAIGITLNEAHLRQATQYAATHGTDWVILTNGATWQVHRMKFEQPVSAELVFDVNLLEARPRSKEAAERLFLLTREGISKSAIHQFQLEKDASSPFLIAAVLRNDSMIGALRRELRRVSPGAKLDEEDLRTTLTEDVLKRDVVVGDKAASATKRVRRTANRLLRRRSVAKPSEPEPLKSTGGPAAPTSV